MNLENPIVKKDKNSYLEGVEDVPESFPVVEDESDYYSVTDTEPEMIENKIIHFLIKGHISGGGSDRDSYLLLKKIGGLNYKFKSTQSAWDKKSHVFIFKTKEFGYATIKLDEKQRESLSLTIASFIRSISKSNNDIERFEISPADDSYSSEEIEECIKEILKSPDNDLTREEILDEHNGFRVFRLYSKIYGKKFEGLHAEYESRAKARSRLFKAMFKKYLSDWEVVEQAGLSGGSFTLKRKE